MLQLRRPGFENAPYSQQLGDIFTRTAKLLVKHSADDYSARLGMTDFPDKSR
jgi:hypothetical protein